MRSASGRPNAVEQVAAWVGIGLHLLVGVFPYAALGLVAPLGGALILWTIWLVLLVVAIWTFRTRPALTPLVPVTALVLWFLVLTIGDVFFDWRA